MREKVYKRKFLFFIRIFGNIMKTIKQEVKFGAIPHEVYELLMDSKKHSGFTGEEAKISREVGGKFSVYGGYAEGENLELIPDKKIVQKWRSEDWPEGHYSTVTFEFEESEEGCKLKFTQENVPDENCKDIEEGWEDYYWKPMEEILGGNK